MIIQMAWRNIWRNPRRTTVILTAVIIGVWSMIFLGALMRGITDRMVQNGIATLTGHIKIYAEGYRNDPVIDYTVRHPDQLLKSVRPELPSDARLTTRIRVHAVANNARHATGVSLVGIEPRKEASISFIGHSVTEGRYLNPREPHGIVVGRALLEDFDTRLGHKLVLMTRNTAGDIASKAFRIVGVFRTESESTEKRYVFVSLEAAQRMLGLSEGISEVCILLADHQKAPAVARLLKPVLSSTPVEVFTWSDLMPLIRAMLRMYDGFILIWFLTVFIAMGFGLVNTILMAVFERIREFGLMRSLGMKTVRLVAEVLAESFFLLCIGVAVGNALGFGSVWVLARTGIDLSAFAAGIEFAGMSRVIHPVLYMKDVLAADLIVMVLGLLISLYPAVKAARITPVEALAHT